MNKYLQDTHTELTRLVRADTSHGAEPLLQWCHDQLPILLEMKRREPQDFEGRGEFLIERVAQYAFQWRRHQLTKELKAEVMAARAALKVAWDTADLVTKVPTKAALLDIHYHTHRFMSMTSNFLIEAMPQADELSDYNSWCHSIADCLHYHKFHTQGAKE